MAQDQSLSAGQRHLVAQVQRQRLVGIRFKAGSQVRKRWRRASLLSESLVGYHGALPDNYGYKHQELADLLNSYLDASRKG